MPYEIYRADHSCLVTVLPINASVRDVLRSLAPRLGRDGEHILVKVNSAGGERDAPGIPLWKGLSRAQPGWGPFSILSPIDKVGLQMDAVGVFTALGLNERLFAVSMEELSSLVSTAWGSWGGQHQPGGPPAALGQGVHPLLLLSCCGPDGRRG